MMGSKLLPCDVWKKTDTLALGNLNLNLNLNLVRDYTIMIQVSDEKEDTDRQDNGYIQCVAKRLAGWLHNLTAVSTSTRPKHRGAGEPVVTIHIEVHTP